MDQTTKYYSVPIQIQRYETDVTFDANGQLQHQNMEPPSPSGPIPALETTQSNENSMDDTHLNELIENTLKETSKDMEIPSIELDGDDLDLVDDPLPQIDPLEITNPEIPTDPTEKEDLPANSDVKTIQDIMHTGLWKENLYKCGATGCGFTGDSLATFKDHLFVCDISKDNSTFKCFHCKKGMKHSSTFVEHVKRHGVARYGCSLCDYRGPVIGYVAKHMKDRHKITTTRTIPLDPFKTDAENDLFVVCPQGKTTTLKRKESNKDLGVESLMNNENRMIFAPNEIELLPRNPISQFDMKCSICSYTSKVRTNMVRHLMFHENSTETAVPDSAPVNPVPCLEKNEKMFDKMVNLANSSLEVSKSTVAKPSPAKPKEFDDLPKYVPENKRFVCGASSCSYLTCDETMLRCHIRTLHMDEDNYKCPHCVESGITLEKIGTHLKMHDTKLYKCSYCGYYHFHKYLVERHVNEKHSEKVLSVIVVRELDTEGMHYFFRLF